MQKSEGTKEMRQESFCVIALADNTGCQRYSEVIGLELF